MLTINVIFKKKKSVAKTAHDRKVVGSNPVTGILDGSGVKATQV